MLVQNYSAGFLASAITSSATTITVNPGHSLPTALGIFTAIIWNSTAYASPAQDPNAEIVWGQYFSPNTYTLTRAQEGTVASAHSAGALIGLYITAGVLGVTKVQSGIVTNSSGFTISNLIPGTTYRLILNLAQVTSNGYTRITFNGDSGANYNFVSEDAVYNTAGNVMGGTGQTYFEPESPIIAAGYGQYDVLFQTVPGNTSKVILTMTDSLLDSSGNMRIGRTAGLYTGGSPLSSITITPSAGTITGTYDLIQTN